MISIFGLYQKAQGRFNTHQGGQIKPSNFVDWVDDTQIEIFNSLIKNFQISQSDSDKLTPFLETVNVLVNPKVGTSWDMIIKPNDYEYYATARIIKKGGLSCICKEIDTIGENTESKSCLSLDKDELDELQLNTDKENCEIGIKLVDNDRWGSICSHRTKKPTAQSPIITQYAGGFKIAPKACATAIIMDYFRRPKKPIFNFVVINPNTENEYFQFVQTGSQDLEWSETLVEDFMVRLQKKYATFVGLDSMYAQAENDKKNL